MQPLALGHRDRSWNVPSWDFGKQGHLGCCSFLHQELALPALSFLLQETQVMEARLTFPSSDYKVTSGCVTCPSSVSFTALGISTE